RAARRVQRAARVGAPRRGGELRSGQGSALRERPEARLVADDVTSKRLFAETVRRPINGVASPRVPESTSIEFANPEPAARVEGTRAEHRAASDDSSSTPAQPGESAGLGRHPPNRPRWSAEAT